MGIKNGVRHIKEIFAFQRGLWHRNILRMPATSKPDEIKDSLRYNVYVDGELMRFKGMCGDNMRAHNREEIIAQAAFTYMVDLISRFEAYIGHPSTNVIVYMDGKRPTNKESRFHDAPETIDHSFIRTCFTYLLADHGIDVVQLKDGESELQMYLRRDKTAHLNVFVTDDSDFIAIAYNHQPNVKCRWDRTPSPIVTSYSELIFAHNNLTEDQELLLTIMTHDAHTNDAGIEFPTSDDEKQSIIARLNAKKSTEELNKYTSAPNKATMLDQNDYYDTRFYEVTDSCLWLKCQAGDQIPMFGMDFTTFHDLTPRHFRIFLSLCGTDFTKDLFTDSMIRSVIQSYPSRIRFINTLDDICEITAMFYATARAGSIHGKRRPKGWTTDQPFNEEHLQRYLSQYLNYIETGIVIENVVLPPDYLAVSLHLDHAIGNGVILPTPILLDRCNHYSLAELLTFVRRNLGKWQPNPEEVHETLNTVVRRKRTPDVRLCIGTDVPKKPAAPKRMKFAQKYIGSSKTLPTQPYLDDDDDDIILAADINCDKNNNDPNALNCHLTGTASSKQHSTATGSLDTKIDTEHSGATNVYVTATDTATDNPFDVLDLPRSHPKRNIEILNGDRPEVSCDATPNQKLFEPQLFPTNFEDDLTWQPN